MEQNRARWSDADQNQKILRNPEPDQKISKYSTFEKTGIELDWGPILILKVLDLFRPNPH